MQAQLGGMTAGWPDERSSPNHDFADGRSVPSAFADSVPKNSVREAPARRMVQPGSCDLPRRDGFWARCPSSTALQMSLPEAIGPQRRKFPTRTALLFDDTLHRRHQVFALRP